MKRFIIYFVASSLMLSSCGGSASLWGQYQTPTPVVNIDPISFPTQEMIITDTPMPVPSSTPTISTTSTYTPTPTRLGNFVTQEFTPVTESIPTIAADATLYYAQSGDWLPAVANRFGVRMNEITSPKPLSEKGLLDPGTLLIIPDRRDGSVQFTPAMQLMPDNEVVYSATAVDFNIASYIREAGGYLSAQREYLGSTGWMTGAGEIERLAYENSIDPRLLLAILDYEAHWVRSKPENQLQTDYPMGYENPSFKGMFSQMAWAINQISMGYYGWRTGFITELEFRDGEKLSIDPTLNAGTVAVMVFFSRQHSLNEWLRIMDKTSGFPNFYQNMFGDPWARAELAGPIFPPGITQPDMILPFDINVVWAYTGGPHGAWEHEGAKAAVDFAPSNDKSGCTPTTTWILSTAAGLVVRSGNGIVVLDLDGDGSEQTGWNILYLHVANIDRVEKGQWVEQGEHIGHASCEGGVATGTHVHLARKYNGEWVIADGPTPFVLSGWIVKAGDKPYEGKLVKGNKIVTADVYGQAKSLIVRKENDE